MISLLLCFFVETEDVLCCPFATRLSVTAGSSFFSLFTLIEVVKEFDFDLVVLDLDLLLTEELVAADYSFF